jgi:O-antigen ligase
MGAMLPNGEIAIHAHNIYLQVAYDHGILAGILFLAVLILALVCGIGYYRRNRSVEPLSLITPAIVIGFMVAGATEWVFQYSNPMTIALMLAVAPLTYIERQK